MAEVILDKVNKQYDNGFHAVKDLDLEIADSEFLVLVGPSGCGKSTALRETRAVLRRLEAGRLRTTSPFALSYAIVSVLARHQEAFVATVAGEVGKLEQRVMRGDVGNPEQFLEELFRARHGLIAVRTIQGQNWRQHCVGGPAARPWSSYQDVGLSGW